MIHESTDCLEVINGPEDGAEFPIVRSPITIGSDPDCEVYMHMDAGIAAHPVRFTVVSEGYRVRTQNDAQAWVNGKRVGPLRSRFLRNGGVLQIGESMLYLRCVPDGLAARSHGLATESDFGWAVRLGGHRLFHSLRRALRSGRTLFGRFSWGLIAIVAAGMALGYFRPDLIDRFTFWLRMLYYQAYNFIAPYLH